MKRKIITVIVAFLLIFSLLFIYGSMGSLETNYISMEQAIKRTFIGMAGLVASVIFINKYDLGKEEDHE